MIIEDKRPDNLTVDDLNIGEIFEAERGHKQKLFIKTDETYDSGSIRCVDISTGEIHGILGSLKAKKLVTRLVIEH